MKAMVLAAGKGERMMPLSRHTPKPMLTAGDKPLIRYHIESLAAAAVSEIIINTGPNGHQIEDCLGNGSGFGTSIHYSHEGDEPLGTGGGVQRVLPQLGDEPFILVNADVWTDFPCSRLTALRPGTLAHLILVANPEHHAAGDFALTVGRVSSRGEPRMTYSGLGLFDPTFFRVGADTMFSFVPALKQAMDNGQVTGEYYQGAWFDIGTPVRLRLLDEWLKDKK